MQKRRNISLTISLGVLLLATALMYWVRPGRVPVADKDIFRIAGLEAIDRIMLESQDREVALHFDGARWKVNGAWNADRNMMDVLFATLQQAVPKRPVAEKIRDSIAHRLETDGVAVSLFEGGELKKTFIAGGDERKSQAYFMQPGGTPYIMTIPGYRVYVSGILELDENGWRNKYVFGFNWRNFQALQAGFPDRPADDFIITMDKDNAVSVNGVAAMDTANLNNYLDDVSLLAVDRYLDAGADSLRAQEPIMHLEVSDVAGRHYTLKLYSPVEGRGFPALVADSLPAVFGPAKIRKIIRPRSYFMKK